MKSFRAVDKKKARKWIWITVAALLALQIYLVQELLAALVLFSAAFVFVGAVVLFLYLFDQAGRRTMAWAEPQTIRAARLARRALARAEQVSKKQLHRQRSETVR